MNFVCSLGQAAVPSCLGKHELDGAMKTVCRYSQHLQSVYFVNKGGYFSNVEVGLTKSVEGLKKEKLRFSGKEEILPQDYSI